MLAADYEQGQGRLEAAIIHAEAAIEANPADPFTDQPHRARRRFHRAADMLSHATQAMDLFPLDANFAYYAAVAALDQGDFTTVVNVLERGPGSSGRPGNGRPHAQHARRCLALNGDPARAFAAYEKASSDCRTIPC